MTTPLPSLAEITTSSAVIDATVIAEFIDVNGHMNVQHYLHLGTLGAGALLELVGLDETYRQRRQLSVFTRKHHVEYLHELRLDDHVRVHAFVVDWSRTAVHVMSYVVDAGRRRLAATVESLLIHVDLTTRRPSPIPADLASSIKAEVTGSTGPLIAHPVSEAIRLRH